MADPGDAPAFHGRTKGVYFKVSVQERHAERIGRRYYVPRTSDDGKEFHDIYEVPANLSEFARDAMEFLLYLTNTWEEIPQR